MTIDILNESINYSIESNNKEKILFIHGFGSNGMVINRIKKFTPDFDFIQVDLPGCGKSTMNKDICSLEYLYEIVLEFLKKIDTKIDIVISHSMGSDIALQLLKNKIVKKAILVSPLTFQLQYSKIDIKENILPITREQAKHALLNLFNSHSEKFLSIIDNQAKISLDYANIHRKFFEKMVDNQILNTSYLKNRQEEIFKKYNNDIFIIVGDNDLFTTRESLDLLSEIYNIKLYVVNDCGHAIFVEQPEHVANNINNIYKCII
ncbi:alpha/beta fold hydrolase [Mycoplasma elephantis]|uniref:alpha/beta fold hydrolase n=1 Tax=Mycoplasma elephantis TaxID=114882 RepID=UPI000A48604C|nr:alpha/beta hydrolase [Mycoplasma elephantis]